jgi:hypothetical protein
MILNMNHFLDESRQQDFNQTENLIKENPLHQIKPFHIKAVEIRKLKEEE